MKIWHQMSSDEVLAHWQSHPEEGLSNELAQTRQLEYGKNQLPTAVTVPLWRRIWNQLSQPLVLVLIFAGAVTLILGEWVDASVIFGVVVINAAVGLIQEGRAEQALLALAEHLGQDVHTVRAGQALRLAVEELVPGDVVHLAAGDKVPADLRLFHANELAAHEAMLTGESLPVNKHIDVLDAATQLAERGNMVFGGTMLLRGNAKGVVVATGLNTETGKIAASLLRTDAMITPLTRQIAQFANQLLWIIIALAAVTFAVGLMRGESAYAMFMAAVALAIGAIPEGLPAAVTITLAIGVARMAKQGAIIRHLPAVETLGGTTVICSDKTGTLTENRMTVTALCVAKTIIDLKYIDGVFDNKDIEKDTLLLIHGAVLCNDAMQLADGSFTGDPTETALLVLAQQMGMDVTQIRQQAPRQDAVPFSAERKSMQTLHQVVDNTIAQHYIKGAPEVILPLCALGDEVAAQVSEMAAMGLRVLAFAVRDSDEAKLELELDLNTPNPASNWHFLGLIGMIDPPRQEVNAAIEQCQAAGIRIKMITGDHPVTAAAIATQLGLMQANTTVLTGQELAKNSPQQLQEIVRNVAVFARVAPEQKLELVRALQANGEIVAMTGDGVNDAPALKAAEIGIAMGKGGTEVAKEAAAMVLTDNNFATLVAAVRQGRGVYANLQKFITWTLPTNIGEGCVILVAILSGTLLPVTPLQILWINMSTALLLGMMLAFEPVEPTVMQQPPRNPTSPLLGKTLVIRMVLVGSLFLILVFGLFYWALALKVPVEQARTIAVNAFVVGEIAYLFTCRSLTGGCWTLGWWSNPWVWFGSGSMIVLQGLFTYWSPMNRLFASSPFPTQYWIWIVAGALLIAALVELEKMLTTAAARKSVR
ncbi:HAD-IC family P-type ATPase [Deefgea tanakiae]|uniref:HAD-IC family P-type ATPase n=1 Tax=Deefgea tanakiae TaxID=2865840 RepID=A0ABX8Z643_9NEIS|nr:HAD-IC family P-type ATPase [Deefgea tanakiae]QZA76493.1 HAD-IC family P-type ATPase [Deefgea tanakiae]